MPRVLSILQKVPNDGRNDLTSPHSQTLAVVNSASILPRGEAQRPRKTAQAASLPRASVVNKQIHDCNEVSRLKIQRSE
jgi:hypothetical protein